MRAEAFSAPKLSATADARFHCYSLSLAAVRRKDSCGRLPRMIAIFIIIFFVSSWFRPFVYLRDQLAASFKFQLVRLKTVEIQNGSHPVGSAKMQTKPISAISPRTSIARIG